MPRIPYPRPEDPGVADLIEKVRASRNGKLPRLFLMHMHNPAILEAWLALGTALRYETGLDDRSRELAICMVSRLLEYDYQYHAHAPIGHAAGLEPEALDRLPDWELEASFTARDRLVLELAQTLTGQADVSGDLMTRVTDEFSTPHVMELIAMISFYGCGGRFLKALQISAEDHPELG